MSADLPLTDFEIDTTAAAPLDEYDGLNHLEELGGLREWLARLQREKYELGNEFDEHKDSSRKAFVKQAATATAIVDEFRRLVGEASAVLSAQPPEEPPRRPWYSFLLPAPKPPSQVAVEWYEAIRRSVESAVHQLETVGIVHVKLLGEDLRVLEYDGTLLKQWVSAKNKPRRESLVVEEEIQGLWIMEIDGKLMPIQRGEVMLK